MFYVDLMIAAIGATLIATDTQSDQDDLQLAFKRLVDARAKAPIVLSPPAWDAYNEAFMALLKAGLRVTIQ